MTPIAIVGMDVRAPGAPNLDALWRMLLAGGEGITEVPTGRWSAADFHDPTGAPGTTNTRNGGFLDDADAFDHEFFAISPVRPPRWTPSSGCCSSRPGARWRTRRSTRGR
jgi:acyl transferase domain-containing protein